MLFSCKITNSVLSFLDREGIDVEDIYASCDLPDEFLRDPSYWWEAQKIEEFLKVGQELWLKRENDEGIFTDNLGHACKELRAFGVLDGVLRIMQKPQDMWAQPERFLSYFISPPPPIANLSRSESHTKFTLPISHEDFPLTSAYLKAVFEALPTYIDSPMAIVSWKGFEINIQWQSAPSLFASEEDAGQMINPNLTRNLILSVEQSQKELEEKNRELLQKNLELQKAKSQLEKQISQQIELGNINELHEIAQKLSEDFLQPFSQVQNQLYRMHDYMARAQQLIVLLVGQGRKDPQVQEAMRRTDWNHVQDAYPELVQEIFANVEQMQNSLKSLKQNTRTDTELRKSDVSINPLIPKMKKNLKDSNTQIQLMI